MAKSNLDFSQALDLIRERISDTETLVAVFNNEVAGESESLEWDSDSECFVLDDNVFETFIGEVLEAFPRGKTVKVEIIDPDNDAGTLHVEVSNGEHTCSWETNSVHRDKAEMDRLAIEDQLTKAWAKN